ncbi:MAG: hypothetical protein KME64_14280 [Scytonematopsis contorta HA4267-MV1]|jgi:hypothetical protein|nr:hypothetical protein [Scytonematopsis contorta HA4267-MV1]
MKILDLQHLDTSEQALNAIGGSGGKYHKKDYDKDDKKGKDKDFDFGKYFDNYFDKYFDKGYDKYFGKKSH